MRHHVEKDNKYNIYFAYTYSKILYGIEVYASACNEHMNKIQVQQKHYRTHTCDLYKDLNLLKVPATKNVQIANIMYKHKQGVLLPVFQNYFICVREFHDM